MKLRPLLVTVCLVFPLLAVAAEKPVASEPAARPGRNIYVSQLGDNSDGRSWGSVRLAMFAGPMREFFESHFPGDLPTIKVSAR